MTRSLRAADGLNYPSTFGMHWLIVDDNNDPDATYPDYAGEAPTLELARQYAASDDLLAALAFAASAVKCGEPWTPECERIINGAFDKAHGKVGAS